MRLFDYLTEFKSLVAMAGELEFNPETGEIIDNSEAIKALFDELEVGLGDKLDNTALLIKELDGAALTIKIEADRLNAKAKALNNRVKRLRELMLWALESSENQKLKTDKFSYNIKRSVSVNIKENLSPENLEDRFVRVKKEFDKIAIKKALEDFEQIEGCSLVENESLQIR